MKTARRREAPDIVLVSQLFHPDPQAAGQLFTSLMRRLAQDGVEVTVLCGHPSREPSRSVWPRHEREGRLTIRRHGLRVDGKRNLLSRALGYAGYLAGITCRLTLLRRAGRVIGVTNPPFLVIWLWALSRVGRFRYEHVVLDAYPEGLIALGRLSRRSALARAWTALNRRAYAAADRIMVIGRDMVPLLSGNYGISPQRFVYLPNWATEDPDDFVPVERAIAAAGIERDLFVVQYSGNMGLLHDMDTLVRAAAALASNPVFRFHFTGDGARRLGAQRLAEEIGATNVVWGGFVPVEDLPGHLAACHASLISLRSGLEGVAVPSKLYGIMASGRAAVAQVPARSEVALAVEEAGCGVVVEPGDVSGLVAALERLERDRAGTAAMGRRGFEAYRRDYTVARAARAFVEA